MSDSLFSNQEIKKFGVLLLRTGAMMQSNGASTSRIRMTVDRIAGTYGYNADLFITQRALTLMVSDENNNPLFNGLKRTVAPRVNFRIISGISRMSWDIHDNKGSLDEMESELNRLDLIPPYPRLVLLSLVGLAGACFCGLANGSFFAIGVAFLATFIGLFVRQEAHRLRFNSYLCVLFASIAATLVSGVFRKCFPEGGLEPAFATSILFLIPGVPFINSFTDLLDGNILNGILRAGNGLITSFCIALGMIFSLLLFNF